MIAEQLGGLDEDLVSRDRKAIREKIETEPKIRKWFQNLTRLSTKSRFDRVRENWGTGYFLVDRRMPNNSANASPRDETWKYQNTRLDPRSLQRIENG
jgi:hypothetical protein